MDEISHSPSDNDKQQNNVEEASINQDVIIRTEEQGERERQPSLNEDETAASPLDQDMIQVPSPEKERFSAMLSENRRSRKFKAINWRLEALDTINRWDTIAAFDPYPKMPNEIWMAIMDYLNAEMRYKFLQAFPLLKERLYNSRTFLRDVMWPMYVRCDYERKMKITDGEPLLPLKDLRDINASIKDEVDKFIPEFIRSEMIGQPIATVPWPGYSSLNADQRDAVANLSMQIFNSNYDHKWYERALAIGCFPTLCKIRGCNSCTEKCLLDFCANAARCLEVIGPQLIRFRFEACLFERLRQEGLDQCTLYSSLLDWVSKMTNLEWLRISIVDIEDPNLESSIKEARKLNNVIYNRPFQCIPSLKRFSITYRPSHQGSCAIVKSILENNLHIEHFGIDVEQINDNFLERFPLRLVKQLNLRSFQLHNHRSQDLSFYTLESLINYSWPLRVVDLSISKKGSYLRDLLECLNQFKTLEVIRMRRLSLKLEETSLLPKLNLPDLSEFFFSFTADFDKDDDVLSFMHLRFLIDCKNLRKIHWIMKDVTKADVEYQLLKQCDRFDLNFDAGIHDLKFMNVWQFFPRLKNVEVNIQFSDAETNPIAKCYKRHVD